jgi:hypothetical protein
MRTRLVAAAVLAGSSGCGSSSASTDAPSAVDAYDTARCLIKGNYGALGMISGMTGSVGVSATTFTATLDPGPPGKDDFFLKLVAGHGVFTVGVMPGTYSIAGADTGFLSCGLCTNIIADIIPSQGPSKFYFTDSGIITLTSVVGTVSGSASNLHFVEVDLTTGSPIPGGCTATIDSVSF